MAGNSCNSDLLLELSELSTLIQAEFLGTEMMEIGDKEDRGFRIACVQCPVTPVGCSAMRTSIHGDKKTVHYTSLGIYKYTATTTIITSLVESLEKQNIISILDLL